MGDVWVRLVILCIINGSWVQLVIVVLWGFGLVVRGVAMNPIDHPHGGGEGKTSGGRSSVSPWGRLAKGKRTIKPYRLRRRKRFLMRLQIGWGA